MRKTYLGEFEELILLVTAILDGQAYGIAVAKEMELRTGRAVSIAAVHVALHRLLEKGYVESCMGGATAARGGRRKRFFTVTAAGRRILREVRDTRNQLWELLPDTSLS